ncbi:MAG: hypothetical protein QHJ73_07725 [Armatimonadota bacterium]|nr:hypothetical protein [Armatimonadota bacterium]
MRVGFGEADITPPVGGQIHGGYGQVFSKGIRDPLKAEAVVFDDGTTPVALVGLDLLGLHNYIVADARQRVEAATGIPGGNVLLACSHNHCGGPTDMFHPASFEKVPERERCLELLTQTASHVVPEYAEQVAAKVAEAVRGAWEARQEALLAPGIGHEPTVSFNRRFRMKWGRTVTHPGKCNPDILEPAGPIDPSVGVLSAWTPEGDYLGCVVNFACHGTCGVGQGKISADWLFFMDETIKGAMGRHTGVVFLNGACGDVTQVNNRAFTWDYGPEAGRFVGGRVGAEAVKVIVGSRERRELAPVNVRRVVMEVPFRHLPPERLAAALRRLEEKPRDIEWYYARDLYLRSQLQQVIHTWPVEVQVIQIGPVVFATNPGEMFCQLGLDIKAGSPFPYTFVVELANGSAGYIPTEEAFGPGGGGYETRHGGHSYLPPDTGRRIVETTLELLRGLPAPVVPPAKEHASGKPWVLGLWGPELA